jgi:hypothetical protein
MCRCHKSLNDYAGLSVNYARINNQTKLPFGNVYPNRLPVEEKFATSRDACLLKDYIPSVYVVNLLNILNATEVSHIAYPREFLVLTVSADSIESQ